MSARPRLFSVAALLMLVVGLAVGALGGMLTFSLVSKPETETQTMTEVSTRLTTVVSPRTVVETQTATITEIRMQTSILTATSPTTITTTIATQELSTWFAPLPPMPEKEWRPYVGSLDFMELFTEDARWRSAAKHVKVFKLYGEWLRWYASDEELKQVVEYLNRHGIAIAFEGGPLVPTETCGKGVEGFNGPEEGLIIARRIKEAGGIVRFVALDEPFYMASIYSGPNACHWPAEKIAGQVASYIQALESIFPDVIVGDIEPLPPGSNADFPKADVDEYKKWIEAWRAVIGSYPFFFHLDVGFPRLDWPQACKELENFARERAIRFGIIYIGDYGDSTDEEWVKRAEERAVRYEVQAEGRPDDVIFQSWYDRPDYVLPEDSSTTFTHLINRYFRTRTLLSLNLSTTSSGSQEATGKLTDRSGAPIPGAVIELSVTPLDEPGLFAEYTLSGIVPDGATQADVGFRVNTECGSAGTSDFLLYEVRYIEGDETANRVPNAQFSGGLDGWGFWGTGTARLEPSDRGTGRMLHVMAKPTEYAAINSAPFPVTPGRRFVVTFLARVSPVSIGSGYFDIVFLAPPEVARKMILLEPPTVLLGSATTDRYGTFHFGLEGLPPDSLLLQAKFPGNDSHWPAYGQKSIGNPS